VCIKGIGKSGSRYAFAFFGHFSWHDIASHQARGTFWLDGPAMIIGHFHFSFTRRPKVDGPFSLCLTYLSALGPAYQACIGRMDGREEGRGPDIMIWIILHTAWDLTFGIICRKFTHACDTIA
jgi:hypothetical protein